jgi:hypothetical protein
MLGTTAALGRGMKTVAVLAKNAVVDFLCGGPYKLDHNDDGGTVYGSQYSKRHQPAPLVRDKETYDKDSR